MHRILISRGFLGICDSCHAFFKEEKMVDAKGRAVTDDVIHAVCPNCHDYNKPLIDDILGSAE